MTDGINATGVSGNVAPKVESRWLQKCDKRLWGGCTGITAIRRLRTASQYRWIEVCWKQGIPAGSADPGKQCFHLGSGVGVGRAVECPFEYVFGTFRVTDFYIGARQLNTQGEIFALCSEDAYIVPIT